MNQITHDVVVIGAGPAGLTAAMFAARQGLKTLVLAKDIGGQLALAEWIENYPGIGRISSRDLIVRLRQQAERDGVELLIKEAVAIESERSNAQSYTIRTAEGDKIETKTIILAFGLTPDNLGCAGEDRLRGRGVYYSAVADASEQDDKIVAVVGGGNCAVTTALELASHAAKVHLVHRRDEFRAERALLGRLRAIPNIESVTPYAVQELRGKERVEGVVLAHAAGGAIREIAVDGVFVCIGYSARTDWLKDVVRLNDDGEVIIDRDCATSAAGILAAGDVTDAPYKQIIISAAEGAKAALQAFKYLQASAGKSALMFDWGAKSKPS